MGSFDEYCTIPIKYIEEDCKRKSHVAEYEILNIRNTRRIIDITKLGMINNSPDTIALNLKEMMNIINMQTIDHIRRYTAFLENKFTPAKKLNNNTK